MADSDGCGSICLPVMNDDEWEPAFREYMLLTALEMGLRGLLYWWEIYSPIPWNPANAARGMWHLQALMFHADVLFTGLRKGDKQPGAALRTLRDVGRQDLVDELSKALESPATEGGRHLGSVISRVRNAFAHMTYDMHELGDDFLFWGSPHEHGAEAMTALMAATHNVLEQIETRKIYMTGQFFLTGKLGDLNRYINDAPQRARAEAKQRRRKSNS